MKAEGYLLLVVLLARLRDGAWTFHEIGRYTFLLLCTLLLTGPNMSYLVVEVLETWVLMVRSMFCVSTNFGHISLFSIFDQYEGYFKKI